MRKLSVWFFCVAWVLSVRCAVSSDSELFQKQSIHDSGYIVFQPKGISILSELFLRFEGVSESVQLESVSADMPIIYRGLYRGIDLVYHYMPDMLESDYFIQPGTSPELIRIIYEGASDLALAENGDLRISLKNGELLERAPVAYQVVDGNRVSVDSAFRLLGGNRVGFYVGTYDTARELVIDPQIVFSTYLGGSSDTDFGNAVAVDTQGGTYVTGYTSSTNFVRTIEVPPGTTNGFYVVKYANDGSLIYATMIHGGQGRAIAVDESGCAYVTGVTQATNLPVTTGAFQPERSSVSFDAFAVKLDADGQLAYCTYLGGAGSDYGNAIAVDTQGHAYVTGWTASTNFPVTVGAYQTERLSYSDNFITKFTADGTGVVYSTYADKGEPFGIAIDAVGAAYITGRATNSSIPDIDAIQPVYGGGIYDAYIIKMNPAGSDVSYATYFGGSERDEGQGIQVDADGNMYIVGWTDSSNLQITNAYRSTGRGTEAYFAKLDSAGTNFIFSSYLGGRNTDEGYGIGVDATGRIYVAGITYSTNFPSKYAIQPSKAWTTSVSSFKPDAFVTQFTPDGSNLIYSTYWGGGLTEFCNGMALSPDGAVSLVGNTESVTSFPVYAATQASYGGGYRDAFVARVPPIDIDDPEMGDTTITNGNIAITWFGEAGWRYAVDYTESLLTPVQWDPLPGFTNVLGAGSLMVATDAVGAIQFRTYRVLAK